MPPLNFGAPVLCSPDSPAWKGAGQNVNLGSLLVFIVINDLPSVLIHLVFELRKRHWTRTQFSYFRFETRIPGLSKSEKEIIKPRENRKILIFASVAETSLALIFPIILCIAFSLLVFAAYIFGYYKYC